jgi:septin family protein
MLQVLVVGDSGLGKTTLVKTLLSTPGERLQVLWDSQALGALWVLACNPAAAVAMHNYKPVAEAIMIMWQL